jgi:hypothetical protein
MTGAYWFFRTLGTLNTAIYFSREHSVSLDWNEIDKAVDWMKRNLKYLEACDEDLPKDQIGELPGKLKYAVSKRDESMVSDTLYRLDDIFQRRYWTILRIELENKNLEY